jgi:hypothetical protein
MPSVIELCRPSRYSSKCIPKYTRYVVTVWVRCELEYSLRQGDTGLKTRMRLYNLRVEQVFQSTVLRYSIHYELILPTEDGHALIRIE